MEQAVLNVLNFQLYVADPIFFLNRLMLYDENGRSEEVTIQLFSIWSINSVHSINRFQLSYYAILKSWIVSVIEFWY